MSDSYSIQAVVFDWAGTTIDHGCRAPALVFREIFRRRGIEITEAEAREPMGRPKREHIAAIAAFPRVAEIWQQTFGQPCQDADVDSMYADFLPLQKQTLADYADIIPGVADVVAALRQQELRIGSSTGYTRELMQVVAPLAVRQGYQPECVLCVEDAPRGRPAPFLLYEAARQLEVYPLWSIIKVDDTPVGITAGRNAGCWTVGVSRTGNEVGLSVSEWDALTGDQKSQHLHRATQVLHAAGAHYVIESVADFLPIVAEIRQRAARGELPL